MSVQAWFAGNDVEIAPGTTAVLQLTVVNLGHSTETFAVAPSGMAAGWTTIHPATVTLFGGSQEDLNVEVRPPLLASTTAGPTGLTVRIVPHTDPDDVVTAETRLIIGPSYDRRLHVLQPALRSRRSATYEMMLENQGNTQASCRMRLLDPSGRVEGDFDPPSIGVEPGGSTVMRLRLRAKRLQWDRRSRTVPFIVEADQPGSPAASAPATFVQAPVLPDRFYGRLIAGLLSVAAIAGVWFGVIQPAIRNEVDDAVADRPVETIVATTTAPDDDPAPTTTQPVVVPTDEGTPFNVRFVTDAAAGTTASETFEIPSGSTLQLTDIVLQNPNVDSGTATLLRGGEVLFSWRLDNILTDLDKAWVSPIEFREGEVLSFQVECAGVGDPSAATCTPALQALGLLVPNA